MGCLRPASLLLFLLFVYLVSPGCSSTSSECVLGASSQDLDCDGILLVSDNCPNLPNASQVDTDRDGIGDLCEPLPCGDGICDPEGGECNVFDYCLADCTQSLCFGLEADETCGDGICQPLAGECANADLCLEDCPSNFYCFPGTCGDNICQPWEKDPAGGEVTFCFNDCICQIEKPVVDACHGNVDCLDQPGTVCGPETFPEFPPEGEPDFSSVACSCTTCGNTVLDPGEGCDVSADFAGVEACFNQGGSCDDVTCECLIIQEQELDCGNALDDDGDSMIDCDDLDCAIDPSCGG